MRKTKIVCTLGPATDDETLLSALISNGMDVARFNFSHGTHPEQLKRLTLLRSIASDKKTRIATMLDTKGPEIRLGLFANGEEELTSGNNFILTTEQVAGTNAKAHVNYQDLPSRLNANDTIYLDDGNVTLKVISTSATDINCSVIDGGIISNRKKVSIPDIVTGLPAVTDKDVLDIKFAIKHHFDYIAASFVRSADHIIEIRKILEEFHSTIKIIAKIENREGLNNINEIIKVADGIMVARGDLGVEIPAEEVPLRQKEMIKICRKVGKPVIIATQMLDSMIRNPRPTRAEASDVANAIFEGADALMLSGETAAGEYPVEAVQMMRKIAVTTEEGIKYPLPYDLTEVKKTGITDAIGQTVCNMAEMLGVKAIITPTQSGYTARMIAKYRPAASIIAVTPVPQIESELNLIWGVKGLPSTPLVDTDDVLEEAIGVALKNKVIEEGDLVIITAGVPAAMPGGTNLIKVHTVGKVLTQGVGIGKQSVTAPAILVRDKADFARIKPDSIIVCLQTDASYVPFMARAAGIVTELGGLTSHAAIVGLNFGKPVVVNAKNIMKLVKDGELITIDCERGLIYSGRATIL